MGIEGKIAKILNTRELVINRGLDHGVVPDMEFAVMEPHLSIVDPDTDELLGSLEREKIRVRVFEAHPKFSLARTYETFQDFAPIDPLGVFSEQARYITKVRSLNTSTDLHPPSLSRGVVSVNIGDIATQVPGPISNVTNKDKE